MLYEYCLRSYLRVDSCLSYRPDVTFFCDLDYDPFLVMQDQDKVYGTFGQLLLM